MQFGKTKARFLMEAETGVKFDDVAGVEEAKQDLQEVVTFLKTPERFTSVGAKIPKGCSWWASRHRQTLLAKAIAGEAGVPFFSLSGSEFVEMFVGVGASRVRDLFKRAKENSPCLIFIDEIDAVGRQRGAGIGGGNDEREQTLNQLLTEMDGFEGNSGIIIIAATNRADVLDSALMRPGRFDRQVQVDVPDIKGRLAVLKVHSRDKKLAPDVSLESIAPPHARLLRRRPGQPAQRAAILTAAAARRPHPGRDRRRGGPGDRRHGGQAPHRWPQQAPDRLPRSGPCPGGHPGEGPRPGPEGHPDPPRPGPGPHLVLPR